MTGIAKATPRLKSVQLAALAMLVVAGVINYIDRATLAVANPLIREELGLSIADMGYLLSAFLWAYAFSQLPTGAMVDKVGPRILLALGLSLWSFAQLLGGLVQSFGQFFGARLLLGIGEAPQFPTGARVVRDWFNQRDRGLATGIFNCASSLGTAIAVPSEEAQLKMPVARPRSRGLNQSRTTRAQVGNCGASPMPSRMRAPKNSPNPRTNPPSTCATDQRPRPQVNRMRGPNRSTIAPVGNCAKA